MGPKEIVLTHKDGVLLYSRNISGRFLFPGLMVAAAWRYLHWGLYSDADVHDPWLRSIGQQQSQV
jgi:hypothetical protein